MKQIQLLDKPLQYKTNQGAWKRTLTRNGPPAMVPASKEAINSALGQFHAWLTEISGDVAFATDYIDRAHHVKYAFEEKVVRLAVELINLEETIPVDPLGDGPLPAQLAERGIQTDASNYRCIAAVLMAQKITNKKYTRVYMVTQRAA